MNATVREVGAPAASPKAEEPPHAADRVCAVRSGGRRSVERIATRPPGCLRAGDRAAGMGLFRASRISWPSRKGASCPVTYVKIVQPAEAGIIREILVDEGDVAERGQVLVRLDPL